MDIDKILISNKISFGEKNYKYFIGYTDDDYKIKPLQILPKTSAYEKIYDSEIKWIYFLTDDELLQKYHDIWNKVSNSI